MQCSINIKLKIYLISLSRLCYIVIRDVFVESDKNQQRTYAPLMVIYRQKIAIHIPTPCNHKSPLKDFTWDTSVARSREDAVWYIIFWDIQIILWC